MGHRYGSRLEPYETVSGFCMDVTEVTVAAYAAYEGPLHHLEPRLPCWSSQRRAPPRPAPSVRTRAVDR